MGWLLRIVFILIAVIGLVIGALLLMPGDKLGAILAEQVKAQTGRELTLTGDVRLSFWPVLGLETEAVTFGNAAWAGPQPMLEADSLAVGVDAAALFAGELAIRRILAENPVLRLEISDGKGNWEFSAPSPGAGSATQPSAAGGGTEAATTNVPSVTLDMLKLSNARLVYVENGQATFDFDNVDLEASWPSPDAPMEMQAQLNIGQGPVDVDLKIPDLPEFSSGAATGMEMTLTAPGGQIGFAGRVNIAGELDGTAQIKAGNSKRMFAALGQSGIHVPYGLGQAADISTRMTYTSDGRLSLREMVSKLDNNRFEGEADIVVADPPRITARLSTDHLDLSKVIGTEEETGAATNSSSTSGGGLAGQAGQGDGWSKDPIDASALALANGLIRLNANAISVAGLQFGKSNLTLKLENSRAVVKMNPARLFSGQISGQVVANNRNGLSVGGKLKADGVDLNQALTTLGGIERLSGKASGSLEFLGVGKTENQIMRSLSGKGRIDMDGGVISGVDLDRLMGKGKGSGGTTVFNSLSASFTMKNGNLKNKDLLMLLDNYRADGAGRIGIGKRNIDYLFTPVALRANSGKGIAVPVRIVGPWSDPSIKPDLTKAIEAATEVKVKELEDDAKQKVYEKVGEELNTTITETEQIEEAVKDKLEDEARKGLLKLLGD